MKTTRKRYINYFRNCYALCFKILRCLFLEVSIEFEIEIDPWAFIATFTALRSLMDSKIEETLKLQSTHFTTHSQFLVHANCLEVSNVLITFYNLFIRCN